MVASNIKREYFNWFSPHLKKHMELLVFGERGTPVIFFPTRSARFYDYENFKIIDAIAEKINNQWLQVYCVDSVDAESFYCRCSHPSQRIERHMQYEQYILQEVMPLVRHKNENRFIIAAGCSLGAYHAANIALRYPHLFGKVVGMSGRYDLTEEARHFQDLFDGYRDENIYYHMPSRFIPNLTNEHLLGEIRKLEIILAVGQEDPFLENNKILHESLLDKGILNQLYIWKGEAHRSSYWRQMVKWYL